MIKDGTGEVYLAGTTSHTGGTHILGGTLSGTTDNLRDFIVVYDNGRLEFDQDSNGSFDGELRGTGSLIKDGTGAVTLTGMRRTSPGRPTFWPVCWPSMAALAETSPCLAGP